MSRAESITSSFRTSITIHFNIQWPTWWLLIGCNFICYSFVLDEECNQNLELCKISLFVFRNSDLFFISSFQKVRHFEISTFPNSNIQEFRTRLRKQLLENIFFSISNRKCWYWADCFVFSVNFASYFRSYLSRIKKFGIPTYKHPGNPIFWNYSIRNIAFPIPETKFQYPSVPEFRALLCTIFDQLLKNKLT